MASPADQPEAGYVLTGQGWQKPPPAPSGPAVTFIKNVMLNSGSPFKPGWMDDLVQAYAPTTTPKEESLLAKILRLYHASMAGDVRSPLIHIVGPPGCGKSSSVEQAAEMLGVGLHIINVSRMSPLDIEGVQMPTDQNTRLLMLTATWWTQLKEGDIVLFDEFLRGFPEVYNGLLDILTSRRVGSYVIPKVFFIAASNSVATYDKALEDRLLHIKVEDPRKNKAAAAHMGKLLIEATGMHPNVAKSVAMEDLLNQEVLPMFGMLDMFEGKANISAASIKGRSIRNLIGQVKLRQIESTALQALLEANNREAQKQGAHQFVILADGKNPDPVYVKKAEALRGNARLTAIQAQNLDLNLQLIEMQIALSELDPEEEAP